jgi:hypothetical protein
MQLRIASPVIEEFEGQLGFSLRDAGARRASRPLALFAFSFSALNCDTYSNEECRKRCKELGRLSAHSFCVKFSGITSEFHTVYVFVIVDFQTVFHA